VKSEVLDAPELVAQRAAEVIAAEARAAVEARGRFIMAISGGRTPWIMLRALAATDMPWAAVQVAQIDERVAPEGHADRNLTHIKESLLDRTPLPAENIHPMPVAVGDSEVAIAQYATTLRRVAGSPPVLDLAQLGLGPDGHTASLVPGDSVLHVADADVAMTEPYQGRRRMTLTYPMINRSRRILWVVTGADKAPILTRLLKGDASIPSGRIAREQALLITDAAARHG
jgi:6-phosphogluconolactonase